ncbi:MAG TPA: ATP-binding protein [Thermomicrobiales bacterium]|nr:ATP-binding protein [Thermomicrobiales bacterium]
MTERPTLQHRLNTARLTRFAGRVAEIDEFRAALAGSDIVLLYLHGPGGVGKSSLLDVFEQEALENGHAVIRIDARDIDLTPTGLHHALEAPPTQSAPAGENGRLVLMLDTWELAAPVDGWLRETFLPSLDADTLVVMSSRNPPNPAWTADQSWAPLMRIVGLRNFRPDETGAFLHNQGIPLDRHDLLAEVSYGHPLALALLCALDREDATTGSLAFRERPDLVQALLGRCLDIIPNGNQRLALAICAHSRATTEELLREAMDLEEARPLFDWLRGLSIVQEGPHGIFPHDLARDVIDADFRWRDLRSYVAMHERVRAPVVRRIRTLHGIEQQKAANDLLYLHRNGPVMGEMHHWASLGQGRAEPAKPIDFPVILEMIERFEGVESAAIARFWQERMPAAFSVFRGAGNDIFGFNAGLVFSEPDAESIAVDPAIAAMWQTIEMHGPLRPGEVVVYDRFQMDRDAYHVPSPGFNMTAMCCLLHWVTTPNLAWSFLSISSPDMWERVFLYLDQLPYPEAAFPVGARAYSVYGHDWRVHPVDPWLSMMGEREIASEPPTRAVTAASSGAQVLSRPDFEQAVRRALRDLHEPLALGRNPLSRSRLVLDSSAALAAEPTLQARLLAAIENLGQSPRDAKLYRAIDRTYLRPAASQELAAEALGLPFNTYRYHLSGAIRRIVDELWRIELGA